MDAINLKDAVLQTLPQNHAIAALERFSGGFLAEGRPAAEAMHRDFEQESRSSTVALSA